MQIIALSKAKSSRSVSPFIFLSMVEMRTRDTGCKTVENRLLLLFCSQWNLCCSSEVTCDFFSFFNLKISGGTPSPFW